MANDETTIFTFKPLADRTSLVRAIIQGLDDLSLPLNDIRNYKAGFKVSVGKEISTEDQAEVIVLIKSIERDEIEKTS